MKAPGWRRVLALVALLAVAVVLARLFLGGVWTRDHLEASLAATGAWGPLLFVLAYVLATVLLMPGSILTLAAGVLFGPIAGILWAWAGGSLGALAAYGVGRSASGPVRATLQKRLAGVARFLDAHSFGSVLTLRLIPIVPFNLLNYGLGFAGVRTRAYVPATLIGIIPGTAAYVLFGAALGNLDRFREPAFYVPLVVAVVLTVVAATVSARYRKANPQDSGETST